MDVYKRLHDAVLGEIVVDWQHGEMRVHLEVSDFEKRTLVAHGLIKLVVLREEPWGPSEWVNGAEGPLDRDGEQILKIEMQSGDMLEIIAREFELPPWEDHPGSGKDRSALPLGG